MVNVVNARHSAYAIVRKIVRAIAKRVETPRGDQSVCQNIKETLFSISSPFPVPTPQSVRRKYSACVRACVIGLLLTLPVHRQERACRCRLRPPCTPHTVVCSIITRLRDELKPRKTPSTERHTGKVYPFLRP